MKKPRRDYVLAMSFKSSSLNSALVPVTDVQDNAKSTNLIIFNWQCESSILTLKEPIGTFTHQEELSSHYDAFKFMRTWILGHQLLGNMSQIVYFAFKVEGKIEKDVVFSINAILNDLQLSKKFDIDRKSADFPKVCSAIQTAFEAIHSV